MTPMSAKKNPLENAPCQYFLGALGVIGGKKHDFAILQWQMLKLE